MDNRTKRIYAGINKLTYELLDAQQQTLSPSPISLLSYLQKMMESDTFNDIKKFSLRMIVGRYHQCWKMYKTALIVTLLILVSCRKPSCDLEYYEKISGVKFPHNIEVVECHDNAEFVTTAFIKIPLDSINEFLVGGNFKKVNQEFEPDFLGMNWISKQNLVFPNNENLYELNARSKSNTWYYLLDKRTGKLWCEIQYPDWGGTPS